MPAYQSHNVYTFGRLLRTTVLVCPGSSLNVLRFATLKYFDMIGIFVRSVSAQCKYALFAPPISVADAAPVCSRYVPAMLKMLVDAHMVPVDACVIVGISFFAFSMTYSYFTGMLLTFVTLYIALYETENLLFIAVDVDTVHQLPNTFVMIAPWSHVSIGLYTASDRSVSAPTAPGSRGHMYCAVFVSRFPADAANGIWNSD